MCPTLSRLLSLLGEALDSVKRLAAALPIGALRKVQEIIDELTDPRVPAWKRALLAATLIEMLGPVKVSLPVRFALRFGLVRLALEAGGSRKEASPASTSAG